MGRIVWGMLLLAPAARAVDPDPWFGADKARHFGATWALGTAGYASAAAFTDDVRWRAGAGAALGLGVGVAKELWDLSGRGDPSWRDLTWDALGSASGVLTAYAFDCAWHALFDPAPAPY